MIASMSNDAESHKHGDHHHDHDCQTDSDGRRRTGSRSAFEFIVRWIEVRSDRRACVSRPENIWLLLGWNGFDLQGKQWESCCGNGGWNCGNNGPLWNSGCFCLVHRWLERLVHWWLERLAGVRGLPGLNWTPSFRALKNSRRHSLGFRLGPFG